MAYTMRVAQGALTTPGRYLGTQRVEPRPAPITIRLATRRPAVLARLLTGLRTSRDVAVLGYGRLDDSTGCCSTDPAPAVLAVHCGTLDVLDDRNLQRLARSHFPARVLWLLDSPPPPVITGEIILEFVQRGQCHGYISNGRPLGEMLRAIRAVASGDLWLPRSLLVRALSERWTIQHARDPARACAGSEAVTREFTAREEQIFELVRDGLTSKEIARRLAIVEDTVKKHLRNMYDKLGVHRRAQLLRDSR